MKYTDIIGLDVKSGLSLVANNKTVYLRLLKSFAANAFCDRLLEAINGGDAEEIRLAAHSLKGVAGNMRMDELFGLSREIEQEAKSGAPVSASGKNVQKIIAANELTLGSVNMLIENPALLDGLE